MLPHEVIGYAVIAQCRKLDCIDSQKNNLGTILVEVLISAGYTQNNPSTNDMIMNVQKFLSNRRFHWTERRKLGV